MMKRTLFSACLLLLLVSVLPAQVPSDCTVPPVLQQEYARDVVNLVITQLVADHHPDTALVHIPIPLRNEIAGGLAAIFNATTIPERDSVFDAYCVHDQTSPIQTYPGYLIEVDTSYAWTQAWQNLTTLTGNAPLDAMLLQYDLHLSQYFNWSFGQYALLHTDSLWNNRALIDSLETIPGVIYGEPDAIIGAAGKIQYTKSGNDRYYDFYFEFNDCFDGCDNYHVWHFKVAADCSVDYLGFDEWGVFGIEPLPAPLNCNISTAVAQPDLDGFRFVAVPNPAAGNTKLVLTLPESGEAVLRLYDSRGALLRELFRGQVDAEEPLAVDVNRDGLPAGVYLCVLRTQSGRLHTLRMVLQ